MPPPSRKAAGASTSKASPPTRKAPAAAKPAANANRSVVAEKPVGEAAVSTGDPQAYVPSRHSAAFIETGKSKIDRSEIKELGVLVLASHVPLVIKRLGLVTATELGFDHEVRKISDDRSRPGVVRAHIWRSLRDRRRQQLLEQ